jgi:hypothetical protein
MMKKIPQRIGLALCPGVVFTLFFETTATGDSF